jgi:hypothetical protein
MTYLFAQRIPCAVSLLVAPDIVTFGKQIDENIGGANSGKLFVATAI